MHTIHTAAERIFQTKGKRAQRDVTICHIGRMASMPKEDTTQSSFSVAHTTHTYKANRQAGKAISKMDDVGCWLIETVNTPIYFRQSEIHLFCWSLDERRASSHVISSIK